MIFSSSMISVFGIKQLFAKKKKCKPVSRVLYLHWQRHCLKVPVIYLVPASRQESIDLPTLIFSLTKSVKSERAALDQGLFDLSTHKVYHAISVTRYPVGSYSTFSPLPAKRAVYSLWHSLLPYRHQYGPFPLGSMALYVARTFLSPHNGTATGRLAPTKITFLIRYT